MHQRFALLSVVFMMCFVIRFDRVHRRNRHYRRLRLMCDAVLTGAATRE
jgi:hypothetical protein